MNLTPTPSSIRPGPSGAADPAPAVFCQQFESPARASLSFGSRLIGTHSGSRTRPKRSTRGKA
ncbi:MAG: hypothetical protein JNJ82_19655 [Opitutaceae bacterium]|jgi:hypothetical protein|nr:hypothetical protein [Opitutaceae bacterium]